jgi:hypothetical protein
MGELSFQRVLRDERAEWSAFYVIIGHLGRAARPARAW